MGGKKKAVNDLEKDDDYQRMQDNGMPPRDPNADDSKGF